MREKVYPNNNLIAFGSELILIRYNQWFRISNVRQPILMIYRFCLQIHLLANFCCKHQLKTCGTFTVTCGCLCSGRKCGPPDVLVPSWCGTGEALPPCFSSYAVNMCPFCHLLSAIVWGLFVLPFVGILPFKMPPKHDKMLCSDPKHKEAGLYVTGNMCVLDKFCSLVLLAMSSVIINQHYISSTVSLSRNT